MSTLVAQGATRVAIGEGFSSANRSSSSARCHATNSVKSLALIKRPKLARDRDYCGQTSDAASSAPRNIAEGFGRFAPIQNANFVRIAIGSEMETKNQITKAWQRGALSNEEYNDGMLLCRRALGAAIGYRRYLLSEAAKANAKKIESNQLNRRPPQTDEP